MVRNTELDCVVCKGRVAMLVARSPMLVKFVNRHGFTVSVARELHKWAPFLKAVGMAVRASKNNEHKEKKAALCRLFNLLFIKCFQLTHQSR